MKKYNTILISLIILILIRCVDEPEPRAQEYPIFQTSVGEIDDSGVTLTIDVLNRGSGVIKQYGFLLGKEESLDFDTNFDISFEDELDDTFSTRISSNLSPDVRYVARGYMILDVDTVFGNAVDFTSLGSLAPTITDFFPTSGIDGDTITLTGTNFSTSRNDVSILFGDENAIIVSNTVEEIKTIIPQGSMSGNTTISLTVFDDEVSVEGFTVNSPTIESISPDSGFDGTEVTLTGSFSKVNTYNKVLFNGINVQLIENSANSLKIVSPNTSYLGNVDIKVDVNGKESNIESFYIQGPEIESVTPLTGSHLDTVLIEGINFDPIASNNKVLFDDTNVEVISATNSVIKIVLPALSIGNRAISIQVANKLNSFDETFEVTSPWMILSSFPGTERADGISFTINGKAYFGLGRISPNSADASGPADQVFNDLWEYDPNSDQWIQKSPFPGVPRYFASSFVISDKAYVGGGIRPGETSNSYQPALFDFYEYDPSTDEWISIANFPESNTHRGVEGIMGAVSFSVNNKGYIGGGSRSTSTGGGSPNFVEYDPVNDHWSGMVSPNRSGIYDCAFTYNGLGYVIIGNELWQLDPVTYTWSQLSDYPGGNRNGSICFVIDKYAYVGTGIQSGLIRNSVYKYDIELNSWAEIPSLPELALRGAIGFSLNNRGYIISGAKNNVPFDHVKDVFLYDRAN